MNIEELTNIGYEKGLAKAHEKGHEGYREAVLYKSQKPSKKQIEEIREAAKRPIVYDDDSPEMTPAAEKAFRLAAVSRSKVLP